MRHPNIVSFIGLSKSPRGELLIITELCDIDLMKLITNSEQHRGCNRLAVSVSMAKQIAASVSFLHAKGIVHRDLKPHNVLVNDPTGTGPGACVCKLCDFGVSTIADKFGGGEGFDGSRTGAMGSPVYMAPEMVSGRHGRAHYDHRVDTYSYGILLWVMWHGRRDPYAHIKAASSMQLAMRVAEGARPVFDVPQGGSTSLTSTSTSVSASAPVGEASGSSSGGGSSTNASTSNGNSQQLMLAHVPSSWCSSSSLL